MSTSLTFTGGCYCRTCQAISGGAGNFFMAVDAKSFQFTKGTPRSFNKNDRPGSPTRHFCGACGVHLTARSERAPTAVLIKVGTLDDPSVFEGPQLVTWTSEMQKFHLLPHIRKFHGLRHKRRQMLNKTMHRMSAPPCRRRFDMAGKSFRIAALLPAIKITDSVRRQFSNSN